MSVAARKLQITGALSPHTSQTIDRLSRQLADETAFAEWRELCQADAVYITALTRVQRAARTAARKENPK